jgi:hypothetical protein
MGGFADILHRYPELAIFPAVGLGCWFGPREIYGIGISR